MTESINTHNLICDFGRHKGEFYTRIPVNYLLWMSNSNHSKKEIAEAELKRRGTVLPEVDVSGHAIDRASLNCRKIWHHTRQEKEGLYACLCRIAKEALSLNQKDHKERYIWNELRLVFDIEGKWPVLKTVINEN